MNKDNTNQLVTMMNCALELDRKIVGVKFLFNQEQYESTDARSITKKINYCVMVKSAMSGRALKATEENLACVAGARALGLKEIDDYHRSGQNGKRLGLYHDIATAKSARDSMSYCDHKIYGIAVIPLDQFIEEPDVVIIVSHPYNIMRIVQGYSYHYGINTNYKMTGNQAICSEATAYPYLNDDINISVLCIGTRHRAGWRDQELAVAFPFNRFNSIVDGVVQTINIMDNNQKKKIIEKKMTDNHLYDYKIRYDHNYYDDIEP